MMGLILAALLCTVALAQVDPTAMTTQPTTRAQVKADARAAERSGTIPRGQASRQMGEDGGASEPNRALVPTGASDPARAPTDVRGGALPDANRERTQAVVSRPEIKAESRAAEQEREMPRGQATPTQ